MTTMTKDRLKVGSKEWRDEVVAKIRENHRAAVGDAEVIVKAATAVIDADGNDPYKITARINTASLDRDREVVLPTGMISSEFDVSGSIFWNHDYNQPCGVAGKVSIIDGAVVGRATFLKRPEDYQGDFFPDFVRAWVTQMAAAGKSAGVSIGFIPVEVRRPTKKDISQFGEDVESVISKWKLLEWSIAPVQSNPDAFVQAVGKSADPAAWKALFPDEPVPKKRPLVMIQTSQKAATVEPKTPTKRIVIVVPPRKPSKKSVNVDGIITRAEAMRRKQLWA